jgi:hypothetical protein
MMAVTDEQLSQFYCHTEVYSWIYHLLGEIDKVA